MDNEKKLVKCAIYTRKSHENGLELSYNSLMAQRESAENYIASQRENGWVALPEHYDDGGFTGGNMDRPALKQLLADIENGKIDCVVTYKIDRLSRSLIDFTKIIEVFNKYGVNFVSVTQQFSTVDSAGRMMLNILITFSQYEREIISDRVRDKIAGTTLLKTKLPVGMKRYLRVVYTVGTAALTAGAYSAFITPDADIPLT